VRTKNQVTSRGVMAVLLFASIVMVSFLTWQQQNQTECNARYNERKARADQAIAAAAEADRLAFEKFIRTLVDNDRTNDRAAVDEYLAAIDKTNKQRHDNPVPAPPPDLCR
jgi:hypothetical protein